MWPSIFYTWEIHLYLVFTFKVSVMASSVENMQYSICRNIYWILLHKKKMIAWVIVISWFSYVILFINCLTQCTMLSFHFLFSTFAHLHCTSLGYSSKALFRQVLENFQSFYKVILLILFLLLALHWLIRLFPFI